MTRRKIVVINEEKCDGCGQCATACAEGAIAIIDNKARLVSETYCDGLGACLGECPQGAITLEEREAVAFDLEATEEHLRTREAPTAPVPGVCPGSAAWTLHPGERQDTTQETTSPQLANWPVQLTLVPTQAQYWSGTKLLISADCVPFAFPDFHQGLLSGRTLLVGCPKLDDAVFYQEKLAEILAQNDIKSIEVAYMEVPCCAGLVRLVQNAVAQSGKALPVGLTKIGIRGEILETQTPVDIVAE